MKRRILLVDDNESFRKPLGEAFRRAGYEVAEAAEGRAALRLYGQGAFDLVVTDLIMPGMEGIETILALRRLQPRVQIIAMSGGGMVESRVPLGVAQQLGAMKTLAKPFAMGEILATVAGMLGLPSACAAPARCEDRSAVA